MTTPLQASARCVTAHTGARDHYQLSLALHEANLLEQLATECYATDWLYRAIPKQAGKRYCAGLPSSAVTVSTQALSQTVRARLLRRNDSFAINQHISRTAYQVAEQTSSNLFLYSYYAYEAFRRAIADDNPRHRILFQLHPHPLAIRQLLAEEIERLAFAAQSIKDEDEFRLSNHELNALIEEPTLATLCVTASQFTRATLIANGISDSRIRVVPYGVNTTVFQRRAQQPKPRPFRVIFVGRMNQRKGLADLLQAVRLLRSRHIDVVVCGRGYVDYNLLNEYKDLRLTVHHGLSTNRLVQELHQSHVFVLPSLAEGFGHVILEAMAAGLPIITTNNTCAPDVMEAGKHGAIVPIRSAEHIAAQLEQAIQQPDDWFEMGQLAAQQAQTFTWERFRRGIVKVYQEETALKAVQRP